LRTVQSARDARADYLAARLATENAKMEALNLLECQGHASWREVAEQYVVIASLEAARRATQQLEAYLDAIEKRLQNIGDEGFCAAAKNFDSRTEPPAELALNDPAALRDCNLRLAAYHAAAQGELTAAQISLVRHQLRFDAYEKLHARGHITEQQLEVHRDSVAEAKLFVMRLTEERSEMLQAYELLRAAATTDDETNQVADLVLTAVNDPATPADDPGAAAYLPDKLPVPTLADAAALELILNVQRSQYDAMAYIEANGAKLAMLEQLQQRLERAGSMSESRERELQFVQLDIDYVRSLSLAARERLQSFRLAEGCFVRHGLVKVATYDASTSLGTALTRHSHSANDVQALPSIEWNGRRQVPQLSKNLDPPFGGAEARPPLSPLPPGDNAFWYHGACLQPRFWCADQRDSGVASDVPDRAAFYLVPYVSRYRPIDSYWDYYEFGRLRPEIYFRAPSAPTPGVPPWYLPGSPQNYPYPPADGYLHVRSRFGVSRSLDARTARRIR
jgi:hypothetical protein